MGRKKSNVVYVVTGEAADQETIIRQRELYEDYVKTDLGKEFGKTNLQWNMNSTGNFDFKLEFISD